MKKNITTVFFDLDETLIENRIPVKDLFGRMYFDFESHLGAENKEVFFKALRSNAANLWSTMFESDSTPEQQFIDCFAYCIQATNALDEAKSKEIGQAMFDHYLQLSANNVRFNDGALNTLEALNSHGITTGVITNGMEQVQMGKINSLDIQNKVDYVNVSAQARAHKPHAPVFELALSRAAVSADNAIQVGDHPANDVAGAIRAGLGGVYYNPGRLSVDEMFAELAEQPTHHISDLRQVLELI
jgi:putative hydrolase of the HAD superfamily